MSRDPRRWHVRTDPICILYRRPRTWWGRRRHDRARGLACLRCLHSPVRVRRVPVSSGYIEVLDTHEALTEEQAQQVTRAWLDAHARHVPGPGPCPRCGGVPCHLDD